MTTSAKVVANNISPAGVQNTTFLITFPRIILAEVNTHKVLAKSASSSRAIPIKTRINDVATTPFVPKLFGKNQPGMVSNETLEESDQTAARALWMKACQAQLRCAQAFADLNAHKQWANRLLEPFLYMTSVVSGTEWENFFALRNHPDAQPEFQELAQSMQEALQADTPYSDAHVHLPFISADEAHVLLAHDALRVSAARCARTSYRSLKTGKRSTAEEDIKLCIDLLAHGHMSPFEHPAIADTLRHGETFGEYMWNNPEDHMHLFGWIPMRRQIERETGKFARRNSFSPYRPPMRISSTIDVQN